MSDHKFYANTVRSVAPGQRIVLSSRRHTRPAHPMTARLGVPMARRAFMAGGSASILTAGLPATAKPSATLLVSHPAFAQHNPGPFIPERPAREIAIMEALAAPAFAALVRHEAPLHGALREAILRVHAPEYFDMLNGYASDTPNLPHAFDLDTVLGDRSWDAALLAVSAGLHAVDCVFDKDGGIRNAFCPVRPPGHHAEAARAMGFCFFSNVAIAAKYACAAHGAERVAVIDFDVHHGNGTQSAFWDEKNLFYGSTHELPLFPGTGAVSETGVRNVFNAPLKAGDGTVQFQLAMTERILPALDDFRPDLILISAGFDAHEGDPLAHIRLQEADFTWITMKVMEIADKHCDDRIVSMLEGGYVLKDLAHSASAHVSQLMRV